MFSWDRESRREYNRLYYLAHREELRERRVKTAQESGKVVRQYKTRDELERIADRKRQKAASSRQYYAKHREQILIQRDIRRYERLNRLREQSAEFSESSSDLDSADGSKDIGVMDDDTDDITIDLEEYLTTEREESISCPFIVKYDPNEPEY